MTENKRAVEEKTNRRASPGSAELKRASDAAAEAQPGIRETPDDSTEARRARRLANLGGGGNAHVLKHREAKRARDSTILSREELAVMLSNVLRNSRTKAPYFAPLAKVLSGIMGYDKGPPPIDPSKPTADLQELIAELQPEDVPETTPDEPEPEAGDHPFAKPKSSNNSTLTAENSSKNSRKNSEKGPSDGND